MLDIAIIGAGLSGLYLAERLADGQRNIALFDARDRYGGRILTVRLANGSAADLGPTWVWPEQQPRIVKLCRRLNLALFHQADTGLSLYKATSVAEPVEYVDKQTHAGAYRIQGGCGCITDALASNLDNTPLHLGWCLDRVADCGTYVELAFSVNGSLRLIKAKQAVLAMPPRLIAARIRFEPALPAKLADICHATQTWMAGHAKAAIAYPKAFWQSQGWSGNALAAYPGAILSEIYDAGDPQSGSAALFGFFGIPAQLREQYRQQLPELVASHLVTVFGQSAATPADLQIQDWSGERFTATDADSLPPITHIWTPPQLQAKCYQN
ncbi:FAD-dependent oxidoreductase [Methylomonas sp. EFPC3]|uniref:flavin monoamine oxidase family protein n=1 Tax=Methylomonas sp. EFPC3 TaxID=3021710 RepID=UPI002416DEBF|nr:FAD-dependent oxidoreductase [Methylomonas sp. EFPC3]WFP51365.1 FAD-dependent oxidoreductase [Methylomonas sp. EFPC3]